MFMVKRWSCVPALLACLSLPAAHARNLFVTPAGDPAVSSISLYSTDPLAQAGTLTANAGGIQVLAGLDGKYFVIGRVASEGVAVLQGTFPNLQVSKRIALSVTPNAAALSPDGRRLIVVGSGGVQVIDTSSETVLPGSTAINVGTTPIAVAVSTDSRRAFVVSQDQQRLFAIDLETASATGQTTIVGLPTSVSVSPASLVYITVQNAIYEFDPQTLEQRATLSLNGFPGTVAFTPDGRFGIAPNTSSLINKSGFLIDLGQRTITDIPGGSFTLSKIVVTDNASAYGYSSQTNRVYYISLATPAVPTVYSVNNATFENVRDIVASNESPAARNLFILAVGNLYKVELAQSTSVGPLSAPAAGWLSYAGPAGTGAAAALLQINNTQTVAPGGTSLPIVVKAVDAQGVPLAGVQVQFSGPSTITLSAPTVTTDLLGNAQTRVSVPAGTAAGVANVTATASGQTVNFTININTGDGNGGGTPTGALTIVKGHGQVTSPGFITPEPLTVKVTDSSGNPAPNVPVTFRLVQGDGTIGTDTNKLTDVDGLASVSYSNFLVPLGVPYTQAVISASTGAETVNFIVTTVANLPNGSRGEAVYDLRKPTDRTITARVGETLPDAINVIVGSLFGTPIPNVGLRIVSDDPNGPSLACRGGVPLSDPNGLIVCDAVAGARMGQTRIRAIAGEAAAFPLTLIVTAGAPANVRITAGNSQTGNAGTTLPAALTVEVADAGGNILAGVPVTWQIISGTATLTETSQTTNNNGRASTRVVLGQQPGPVQIRVTSGAGTATFGATVTLNAAALQIAGGNNQSAVVGQAFTTPISVRVIDDQNRPIVGTNVAFQVTAGSATVPASATTDANGIAATNVTAGQTPGPVTVAATLGSLSQSFNLTVRLPGPAFTTSSIVNAAGYQPGISPGGIAVISASGIAPNVTGSVTPATPGPLPTTLAGVEVLFNNVLAPIYSVSNINGAESVNVQVPFETSPGTASVTIRVSGGGSTTVTGVAIQALKPGIFDYVDTNGQRTAVALRPDGSYISAGNPARLGENIRVFAAGLGQTSPSTGTNQVGGRDQNVSATVIAGINNEGVRMISAKLVEGSVGVYIVEMEIPANTTTGAARNVAIAATGADGVAVFAGSTIPIQ